MKKVRKTRKKKLVPNEFMKLGNHLGLFFLIWFVICFAWFYVNPVEQYLHESLMRLSFFLFYGMNLFSFISGAVQSYIWGYVAVGTWMLATKISCWRK